ncbi:beta-lactamase family protein [Undibacterium sp. LX40W]|uniref:Beta-lactamase family protein n=1 Tax=Undibacterium nitidum TaxID=2762298 RepID=A0A923KUD3_9BURK|nr:MULTISPECIES: serine hydrolase domain-containing protein [Undibacterium]MBC3883171.1 beta-lactamase family protein [Undibacterium nitidum]MBC3893453.1 beta-lactamase family protein [Undibacterium sp. LX40W]
MSLSQRRQFLKTGILSAGAAMYGGSHLATSAAPINPVVPAPFESNTLTNALDKAISSRAAPGIALSVWHKGAEVYSQQVGYANLETGTPVNKDSIFRIGSLSKQFTAAMLLKLAESEALQLDDPVKKYLPYFATKESFSIRELLQHTAGIHDADVDPRTIKATNQIELAQLIAKQKKVFDFAPGTAWLYSNSNYFLAGAIIEHVTSKSLTDAGKALLFDPLKLSKTSFDVAQRIVPYRAAGYALSEEANLPFTNAGYEDMVLNGAAGGMISNASDLCRWHHLLLSGAVFSPESLAQLMAPGLLRNKRKASTNRFSPNDKMMGSVDYGLGLLIDHESTSDQSAIIHHHGGVMGFASMLVSHPASGLTYACLCNADTNPKLPFRELRRAILTSVLKPVPVKS